MGVSYIIRPSQKGKEDAVLSIRIQKGYRDSSDLDKDGKPKVKFSTNIFLAVPKIRVDAKKWVKNPAAYRIKYSSIDKTLRDITDKINSRLDIAPPMTSEEAKDIINSIVFADEIQKQKELEEERKRLEEEEKKRQEEASRMTLNKFIDKYISEAENGARQTNRGTNFAPGTIKAIKQSVTKFREYQTAIGRELDFKDMDLEFYKDFTAFLKKQDYSINSIGKAFKELKSILSSAESEDFNKYSKYRDNRFKAHRVEVDAIYLTEDDLQRIAEVDLSGLPRCYEQARDIFFVGVYTAQRVSDYNNIGKDSIKTSIVKAIEGDRIVDKELVRIELRQQKTGAKVSIPCKAELRAILEKYDYSLPHLWDQKINDYIKVIGEMAGLTDLVEITSTKGGKEQKIQVPKYSLIHTHTARRTGATLMYLAGVDVYDIMKITGHSTPAMLKKYIKADSLQVAEKIADRYDYFK